MQRAADGSAAEENAGKPGLRDAASPGGPAPAVSGDGKPVRWCRVCGEPVTVAPGSYPYTSNAVHTATGIQEGPDGHLAMATDAPPEMTAVARAVAMDFPGWEIAVCFGNFYRAVRRSSIAPVPVEANTEQELRQKISARMNMRRWVPE